MKTNKEKFKAMTSKQKVEYIWEYYRWHIVGTIIGLFVVGQIIHFATTPKPSFDAHLIVTARMVLDTEKAEEDEKYFRETFNTDIYYLPADWSVIDQTTIVNDQLLMLKMQVREADLFAMSKSRYDKYMEIEGFDPFMPLEEVPGLEAILEEHKDNLLVATGIEDQKEHVYGIQIEKTDVLHADIKEPLIISIMDTPKNMEKTIQIIEYLLQ